MGKAQVRFEIFLWSFTYKVKATYTTLHETYNFFFWPNIDHLILQNVVPELARRYIKERKK